MNFESIIFSLVLISVLILGIGTFYTAGALSYGISNYTNLSGFSQFDSLSGNLTKTQANISGGTVQTGDTTGNFWDSAIGVTVDLFTGKYLIIANNFVSYLVSNTGLPFPDWVSKAIILFLLALFIIAALIALREGKIQG